MKTLIKDLKTVKIYNSLTKDKETFVPIKPKQIGLYVCGITVYDYCHIGHARTFLVFDVIARFLNSRGYDVKFVRNITDIDDKIIQRSLEAKEDFQDLTARMIKAMHEDFEALGMLPPTLEPRATEYMDKMIALIERLIAKDVAYVGAKGDVYFHVPAHKPYGCLSGQDLNAMQTGNRVEVAGDKKSPLDFVLWKMSKPGEPAWDSPWGKGRPGWHIECSAMSMDCLGETFDIHGGGHDLKFPHHENECAQSMAATEKAFAKLWMHVGFLQIDQEKMSKSLGNFATIRDVLKQIKPETLRFFSISGHYRSPIEYTSETIQAAQNSLERLYTALRGVTISDGGATIQADYEKRFIEAMEDDFNTPEALAVLFDLSRELNTAKNQDNLQQAQELGNTLKQLAGRLGLCQEQPEAFLQTNTGGQDDVSQIEALIAERNEARAAKDWAKADAARNTLSEMGVTLEDTPNGTLWRR